MQTPIGLIEEFLLLALEDQGGEFDRVPEVFLRCGMAGAALMDLSLRGRIDSDLQAVFVVDATPTGDTALDDVLREIAAEPHRLPARYWLEHLSREGLRLRAAALARLCELGILQEQDHQYLWVMRARRYPLVDGVERPEVKRRLLALLYGTDIPDATDIALVSIASACGVFERILTATELRQMGPRIAQLAQLDLVGGQIARTAHEVNEKYTRLERKTALAGFAGNVLEWYDFGVYGFFAAIIGKQFFPAEDASVSLLASFGVYGVGFVSRPLGAALFGFLGDRVGRRTAVMISVLLMVVPTTLMGLLPTYAQIGIMAPVLLITARFLQGLSAGGEYTTSIVMLVERAQPNRRGWLGGFGSFGGYCGTLLGALTGAGIMAFLPADLVATWGWRCAFLFGLVIGFVVFMVRRTLPDDEAEVFAELEEARSFPLVEAFRDHWKTMFRIMCVQANALACGSLVFVYLATWLQQTRGIPVQTTLLMNSASIVVALLVIPYFGSLSDRYGRKPVLLLGYFAMVVFAWPLFVVMKTMSLPFVLLAQCAMSLILGTSRATSSTYVVEAFPRHVRCSALGLAHNSAAALFSGMAPMIAVFLIKQTGSELAPAFYIAAASVLSFVAVLVAPSPYRPGEDNH